MSIVLIIFSVYLIKRVRVFGLGTDAEDAGTSLGIWGYFWRAFVVQLAAIMLIILPFTIALILYSSDSDAFFESLLGTILIGLTLFPITLPLMRIVKKSPILIGGKS